MKTISQALKDELALIYPIPQGLIGNRLTKRGLNGNDEVTADILNSKEFIGVTADCLYALVIASSLSESDISITLTDRNLILKQANRLYADIGEEEKQLDQPNVYVGPPEGTYVSH